MTAFVRIDGLTRRFDVSKPWLTRVLERRKKAYLTAASEVTLEIPEKGVYALVGESGSGKSTIGKIAVGLLPPSDGRVEIDGYDVRALSEAAPETGRAGRALVWGVVAWIALLVLGHWLSAPSWAETRLPTGWVVLAGTVGGIAAMIVSPGLGARGGVSGLLVALLMGALAALLSTLLWVAFPTGIDGAGFVERFAEFFALVVEPESWRTTMSLLAGLGIGAVALLPLHGYERWRVARAATRTSAQTALRSRIQMIFQDPYASLNPRWRVGDIIAEPAHALGMPTEGLAERLLEQVGLSARDVEKFPHEFSGGQRQRICVARALASEPRFIVCDEPTSALDVSVQAQVLNLMRDLQARLGLTYLFISHDLSVVRYMADRIGVLYLGRLVEEAPRDALFEHPRHPYTQMLLEAAPRIDQFGREVPPPKGEIPDPINPPTGCAYHPRCPYANARCSAERPLAREVGATRVACHAVEEGRI